MEGIDFIITSMLNLMPIRSFSIMMNLISIIVETFLISMGHLGSPILFVAH